jgi:NosR/NirI family transcriptional regulator, nitrous oxide reductase regulator
VNFLRKYTRWLHTQWPAGDVEKLPVVNDDGSTAVPGLYVAGDLRGVPLLKFSADTGARVVRTILADAAFQAERASPEPGVFDLVIIGGGVAGMSAALEARKAGLRFQVLEAGAPFSTIVNFPKGKPIYTYPKEMKHAGDLRLSAQIKEDLVEELLAQTVKAGIPTEPARAERVLAVAVAGGEELRARRVLAALGRSGNFRKLGAPGENLDKVYNRLHDPKDFAGRRALVVGGGDSALETAVALAQCGADVALSYRKPEFARPKPENVEKVRALAADPSADVSVEKPVSERVTTAAGPFLEGHRKPGRLRILLGSQVLEIKPGAALVRTAEGKNEDIPNDVVFSMIGREAPLEFFRRSGVPIAGEWSPRRAAGFAAFLLFCIALYDWKSGGFLHRLFYGRGWFPTNLTKIFAATGAGDPGSLVATIAVSASSPSFWYTLAYSSIVTVFGIRRIRRRRTPYITRQTVTLMAVQVVPLFFLPEIILPWLGNNDLLPVRLADALFPQVTYGHGREYWRAYGFILAWPLMIYNVFTDQPLWAWLGISVAQTFVAIPAIIYFWGKGAYCGWICSCGALAETLGDAHRQKMPHGPAWNRLNMAGQAILAACFLLLGVRVFGWLSPGNAVNEYFRLAEHSYKWAVDVTLAGVVGVGFYFWFSGRVWCRFFCPLAALMHVYARFSRFRIFADKKKCISCNVCTSVCHQGIDVMNFANKGLPMADPECVRCSACVQSCPTGVLSFGQADRAGRVIKLDLVPASPVQMANGETAGERRRKLDEMLK